MLRRALAAMLLGLLAAAPASAPAQSNDPSFRIVNNTPNVVNEVYASPSRERNWGQDRLGDAVVQPGQRFAVRLPMGECNYDLRVVFTGGEAQERQRVNACNLTDY